MSDSFVCVMQDVEGLGQEGDVVRVRHGFARNILIPSKKAVPGTTKNIELYGQRVLVRTSHAVYYPHAQWL